MTRTRFSEEQRAGASGVDRRAFVVGLGTLALAGCSTGAHVSPRGSDAAATPTTEPDKAVRASGAKGLLEVIKARRSHRAFSNEGLSDEQIGVLLRAAQGVTDAEHGLRAVPSAGAVYPLVIYVATTDGLARYDAENDRVVPSTERDLRAALAAASWGQDFIADAPAVFVITGNYSKTRGKYGERGVRYVHLEAGHAAQNLLLAAGYLGLGGVTVGSYGDDEVRSVIGASRDETPLYVIPVGHAG